MTYQEMMENAKLSMGLYCKACPVCDGRACKNQIPGPGAKGVGDTAIRNYKKWQEIRVNMDTICDGGETDTSVNLFGKEFKMPFFAASITFAFTPSPVNAAIPASAQADTSTLL